MSAGPPGAVTAPSQLESTSGAAAPLELRLALALDAAGAGEWEWNLDSGLVHCSDRAAAALGLPRAGWHPVSKAFATLDDGDLGALHAALANLFSGRADRLAVDVNRRGEGVSMWLRLSGVAADRSDSGEPHRVVGLVQDITAARQREGLLTSVHKLDAIGGLAAGVAHEINTPLQFVSHNLDFLAREVASIASSDASEGTADGPSKGGGRDTAWWHDLQAAIAESIDGLDRVTTIVRALKQFAHRGSGPTTAVDVNAIIESAVTLTRPAWKVVATVHLELAPGLPPVAAAAVECGQVFVNVLVNAADAVRAAHPAGSSGTITIVSRLAGPLVEVRVTDTGFGIPPDVQPRVFEPFFTTKAFGVGTGQGLATARAIVERHGGFITFETEVGRGTTFVVGLPLATGVGRVA